MGLSTKQVNSNDGLDWAGKSLLDSGGPLNLPQPPPARRQPPQQPPEPVACPRCGSTNTKFCYYNNYNKSQPRHFCRACKRHWTKGGTLRNVPVGGGRKNKRRKTSTAAATTAAAGTQIGNQSQSRLPLPLGDQKEISEILFHDFINNSCNFGVKGSSGSNGNNFVGPAQNLHQNQIASVPFTFPPCSISTSFGFLDNYNFTGGLATNINNDSSQPILWQVPTVSGGGGGGGSFMDMWNWDEMELLASADQLNIPWDDIAIKP